MKNIKKISLAALTLLAVGGAAGCGSDEKPLTPSQQSAAREQYIKAVEHPDWATVNDSKINAVCGTRGVLGTTGVQGGVSGPTHGVNSYSEASQTIGVIVTCGDKTAHTVIVGVPRN